MKEVVLEVLEYALLIAIVFIIILFLIEGRGNPYVERQSTDYERTNQLTY
jgi:uncharacterized protein YxeA